MFETIKIDGFRGLDGLQVNPLGKVNLIVGPGNIGKTNFLESVFLFCSNGDPSLLLALTGMRRIPISEASAPQELIEVLDWFWSHSNPHPYFAISGKDFEQSRSVRISRKHSKNYMRFSPTDGIGESAQQEIRDTLATYAVETTASETCSGHLHVTVKNVVIKSAETDNIRARFVNPLDQGNSKPLAKLWTEVEERGEEEQVVTLMKELDPEIESIRIVSDRLGRASLRFNHKRFGRMPIEMEGAGIGKAISMANDAVNAAHGILLIDEFENSLHVSALRRLCEFVFGVANRLQIQLFITTHSLEALDAFIDAYESQTDLFSSPADFRILQFHRKNEKLHVNNLDVDEARNLREEIGLDLRRSK